MLKEQTTKEKIMLTVAVVLMLIGLANAIRTLIQGIIDVTSIAAVVEYALIILYATVLYKKPHGNLLKILIMLFAFIIGFFAISAYQSDIASAILSSVAIVLSAFMAGRLDRYKQNKIIAIIILAALFAVACKDAITTDFSKHATNGPEQSVAAESIPEKPEGEEDKAGDGSEPPELNGDEKAPVQPDDKNKLPEGESGFFGTLLSLISFFNMAIMWTAIFFGYCARYRKHKEAGLADAPQKA